MHRYRNFYTGVEAVDDERFDLLLVTLDKGRVAHEHLDYRDFPITERLFHWQSKSTTRQDDDRGQRHLNPDQLGVTPLLLVRESKRDTRGLTGAFLYLGSVRPHHAEGERPITIEWELAAPAPADFVRDWSNVG